MSTKLSTVLFLLNKCIPGGDRAVKIASGATLALALLFTPASALAVVTYFESGTGGTIELANSDSYKVLGEFVQTTTYDYSNSVVSLDVRTTASFCQSNDHLYIGVYDANTAEYYFGWNAWGQSPYVTPMDSNYRTYELNVDFLDDSSGSFIVPPGTYELRLSSQCNFGGGSARIVVRAESSDTYFTGQVNTEYSDFVSDRTRIISAFPDEQTVSSSTPFSIGADVYINNDDWSDDLFVRLRYVRQEDLQSAVANKDVFYTYIDFPVDVSDIGYVTYSTTTSDSIEGKRLFDVEIRQSSFWHSFLGWFSLANLVDSGLYDSYHTSFVVGETTTLDDFIDSGAGYIEVGVGSVVGSLEDLLDSCNPISGWDTSECLYALFFPSREDLGLMFDEFRDLILTKAPVGYVTRLTAIMTSSATSTLPGISLEFKSNSPVGSLGLIEFDFDNTISEATDILMTSTSDLGYIEVEEDQTIWDILMPIINAILWIGMFIIIFADITGIDMTGRSGSRAAVQRNEQRIERDNMKQK